MPGLYIPEQYLLQYFGTWWYNRMLQLLLMQLERIYFINFVKQTGLTFNHMLCVRSSVH